LPAGAAFCGDCGAIVPRADARAAAAVSTPDGADPWRPTPLPLEIRTVIGLIVLELSFCSWIGLNSPEVSTAPVIFSILLGVAIILDLIRRTILAWWVAVGLSLVRVVLGLSMLGLVSAGGSRSLPSDLELGTYVQCFVGVSVIVLLIHSRVSGKYLIRLEGERRQPGMTPRIRKTCRQCGDPCPDIDNNWTRAGLCSKKCAEKS